jgi:hypothetical protein
LKKALAQTDADAKPAVVDAKKPADASGKIQASSGSRWWRRERSSSSTPEDLHDILTRI